MTDTEPMSIDDQSTNNHNDTTTNNDNNKRTNGNINNEISNLKNSVLDFISSHGEPVQERGRRNEYGTIVSSVFDQHIQVCSQNRKNDKRN